MQLQRLSDDRYYKIVDLMTELLLLSNGGLNEDKLHEAISLALSGLEDDLYNAIEDYYS